MVYANYVMLHDVSMDRMGDKGELLVKTEVMCDGYYNNEAQTASAFADGWYVRTYVLLCFFMH